MPVSGYNLYMAHARKANNATSMAEIGKHWRSMKAADKASWNAKADTANSKRPASSASPKSKSSKSKKRKASASPKSKKAKTAASTKSKKAKAAASSKSKKAKAAAASKSKKTAKAMSGRGEADEEFDFVVDGGDEDHMVMDGGHEGPTCNCGNNDDVNDSDSGDVAVPFASGYGEDDDIVDEFDLEDFAVM